LRCSLARNTRRLVEEKYTWERSVALLEGVYQLAVGQGKGERRREGDKVTRRGGEEWRARRSVRV